MNEDVAGRRCAAPVPVHTSRRQCAMQLLAVLGVCAAVRIWLICNAATIAPDGALYVLMARQWSADPARVTQRYTSHVGYPAAMATVRQGLVALGGDKGLAGWELAGQLISLVASLGALAALWIFARRCFDDRVAWMTVLLFGLSKKWAFVSSDVLTDAPAACLTIWAVVLAMCAGIAIRSQPSRRTRALATAAAAGAGLSGAGAYLVRVEGMLVVPLAVVFCLWAARARGRWGLAVTCTVVLTVTALAAAGPYMAAIGGLTRRHDADKVLSMARVGIAYAAIPLAQIPLASGQYPWPRHLVNKLFEAMHPALATLACVAVGAWIIGRLRRQKVPALSARRLTPRGQGVYWIVAWAALLLPLVLRSHARRGILSYRYLLTLAVMLSPLAAVGLLLLADLTRGWLARAGKRLACVGATAVIAAVPMGLLANTLRPMHITSLPYRRAGEALARLAGPVGDDIDPLEDLTLHKTQIKKHAAAIRARGDAPWSNFVFVSHMLVLHHAQMKGFCLIRAHFEGRADMLDKINRCGVTYMAVGDRQVPTFDPPIFTEPVFTELGTWSTGRRARKDTVRLYRVNRPALRKARAEISAARRRARSAKRRAAPQTGTATTRPARQAPPPQIPHRP